MFRFSPESNQAHLIQWREWGSEAFQQARDQDKPVMLFLTAFWCAVCQLMDEQSFSNDEVIALLNAYFVCIRVEDAQRPDINVRYNQNGWPTIAFLTHEGIHLTSVNYQPSEQFGDVLVKILQIYREEGAEIRETASKKATPTQNGGPDWRSILEVTVGIPENIAGILRGLCDETYGGYGHDHKYPHVLATEFLLEHFEKTGNEDFLVQAEKTLDRIRHSLLYDEKDGGFFRYSSKPDWSEPHYEKLLIDQAGLLRNYLRAYVITEKAEFRLVAEELISYLNDTLTDPLALFYGCQDYVFPGYRGHRGKVSGTNGMYSIIDHCIYVDANAQTILAYFESWWVLGREDCKSRALRALDFLWDQCRSPDGSMFHWWAEGPKGAGLLTDMVYMGLALVAAHQFTGLPSYLERAKQMGAYIAARHFNPTPSTNRKEVKVSENLPVWTSHLRA